MNLKTEIVVADDDADDVEILKDGLNRAGISYILRHAEHGDMLFILLKDKLPHMLFLDIHMPCKDGISCIIEIRKNSSYDKLPIIMYTSHKDSGSVHQSFTNGANFYLAKPSDISEFTNQLKKIFSINWENHIYYPAKEHFLL